MDGPLRVVIEGIGDVVQNYYTRALIAQKKDYGDELSVIFTDWKSSWSGTDKEKHYQKFVDSLSTWGAHYIDKSTVEGEKEYNQLQADVVFIATPDRTHINIVLDWLANPEKCQSIFIEKPLDSDVIKAKQLLPYLEEKKCKVRALDHYRARVIPLQLIAPFDRIMRHLDDKIVEITFYLLEDGSGEWKDPIRRSKREDSLRDGLIFDLFPHVLALLNYFGVIETFRLTSLKVGRYFHYDQNNKKVDAPIPNETFAQIRFSFKDFYRERILGKAFVGKGLSGSTDLKIEKGDVKRLELHGINGNKCIFDLRNPKKRYKTPVDPRVRIVDKDDNLIDNQIFELYKNPYDELIERIILQKKNNDDSDLGFDLSFEEAKNFLDIMHEINLSMSLLKKAKRKIPPYEIKFDLKGESMASTLEEVDEKLPWIHKRIPVTKLRELLKAKKTKRKKNRL